MTIMKITDIKFKEYNTVCWIQTTIKVDNMKIYTTNQFSDKVKAKEFEAYIRKYTNNPFEILGILPTPYVTYPEYDGKKIMELKATFTLYKLNK